LVYAPEEQLAKNDAVINTAISKIALTIIFLFFFIFILNNNPVQYIIVSLRLFPARGHTRLHATDDSGQFFSFQARYL
jgi:hypothetical protein